MAEIPTWQCVVAGALIRADGRVLMHRRPLEKHHGGLWEFPGGKVEQGELPPAALVRELQEELGITVDPHDLAPSGFAESGPCGHGPPIVILLYTVSRWAGDARALDAGAAVEWFALAALPGLSKPPMDEALLRNFLLQRTRLRAP